MCIFSSHFHCLNELATNYLIFQFDTYKKAQISNENNTWGCRLKSKFGSHSLYLPEDLLTQKRSSSINFTNMTLMVARKLTTVRCPFKMAHTYTSRSLSLLSPHFNHKVTCQVLQSRTVISLTLNRQWVRHFRAVVVPSQ